MALLTFKLNTEKKLTYDAANKQLTAQGYVEYMIEGYALNRFP